MTELAQNHVECSKMVFDEIGLPVTTMDVDHLEYPSSGVLQRAQDYKITVAPYWQLHRCRRKEGVHVWQERGQPAESKLCCCIDLDPDRALQHIR